MQKLILMLASSAGASELFLTQPTAIAKEFVNAKISIDIKADDIAPCQYITETSVFSFTDVLRGSSATDKASIYQPETKDNYYADTKYKYGT